MSALAPIPTRRSFLKFVGTMPLVLASGGLLSGCATEAATHTVDRPHLGSIADDYGAFPSQLEDLVDQEMILTGFVRRTPSLKRLLLTQRAVGCPVCEQQRLWSVVELQMENPDAQFGNSPVQFRGKVELRRFGNRLPVALKQAHILSA
jgi:hypothetical protein